MCSYLLKEECLIASEISHCNRAFTDTYESCRDSFFKDEAIVVLSVPEVIGLNIFIKQERMWLFIYTSRTNIPTYVDPCA